MAQVGHRISIKTVGIQRNAINVCLSTLLQLSHNKPGAYYNSPLNSKSFPPKKSNEKTVF